MFRIKTNMVKVKMNYQNDPRNSKSRWRCDSCQTEAPETQAHVLYCPAYQSLRIGKDINNSKDLVDYFTKVMMVRSDLGITT